MLKFRLLNPGGGQRQFLASDALHFAHPGVGIEFGRGEKLVAGLFDGVFHPQPVEQRALGLLLAGCDFGQVPNELGSPQVGALAPLIGPTYGLIRLPFTCLTLLIGACFRRPGGSGLIKRFLDHSRQAGK